MPRLSVFNSVSLDGYFTDANGDMSWAHAGSQDAEWMQFVEGNASGGGRLMFGRITYEMMASFWPNPMALEKMPVVAEAMNERQKFVFSRTLTEATWSNTELIKDDLIGAVKKLKSEDGSDIAILGSGSVVAQLAKAGLIDYYQLAIKPIVLGGGRSMLEGVKQDLRLVDSRTFGNGSVVLSYEKE